MLCHVCVTDARTWERADEQDAQNRGIDSPDINIVSQDANNDMDFTLYGNEIVAEEQNAHSETNLVSGEFETKTLDNSPHRVNRKKWWPIESLQRLDDSKKQPKYITVLHNAEIKTSKEEEKRESVKAWQIVELAQREIDKTNQDKQRMAQAMAQKMSLDNAPNKPWYEEKGPIIYSSTPMTLTVPTENRIVENIQPEDLPDNNFQEPEQNTDREESTEIPFVKKNRSISIIEKRSWTNQQYGNPQPVENPPPDYELNNMNDAQAGPPAMYPPWNQQGYIPPAAPMYPVETDMFKEINDPRGMPQNQPLPPVAYPPNPPILLPSNIPGNNPLPPPNYYNPPNMVHEMPPHYYNQPVYPMQHPAIQNNRGDQGESWHPRESGWMPIQRVPMKAVRPLFSHRFNLLANQKQPSGEYDNFEEAWHKYAKEYREIRGETMDKKRKRNYGYTRDAPCDPVYSFCDHRKRAYYYKNFKSKGQKQSELGKILGQDYSTFFASNKWFVKNTLKNVADAFVKGIQLIAGKRGFDD